MHGKLPLAQGYEALEEVYVRRDGKMCPVGTLDKDGNFTPHQPQIKIQMTKIVMEKEDDEKEES